MEILVLGAANIDLTACCSHLPRPGETIRGSSYCKSFGGKGANQAIQCARLGLNVSFCGKVGCDSLADDYFTQFSKEKVTTTYLHRCDSSPTGIACISVDATGNNSIIIIPGANGTVTIDDVAEIDKVLQKDIKIVICQNEIPPSVTKEVLGMAKRSNTVSIFNPAPALPFDYLREIIELSTIVCPNETELSTLTGLPTESNKEVIIAAQHLLVIGGCQIVITTLGARGAVIVTNEGVISLDAPIVQAVDTVGAGDAFIGALASNLARGARLETGVRQAIVCASLSVTRLGAQQSYASLDELAPEFHPPPLYAGDGDEMFRIQQTKQRIWENLGIS